MCVYVHIYIYINTYIYIYVCMCVCVCVCVCVYVCVLTKLYAMTWAVGVSKIVLLINDYPLYMYNDLT